MKYNTEYINVKYALLNAFMLNAGKELLDISYNINRHEITIQIVLLKGRVLSDEIRKAAIENLPDYNIIIKKLYITKEQFNANKGEWTPKDYNWLDNLLFCKAEVL